MLTSSRPVSSHGREGTRRVARSAGLIHPYIHEEQIQCAACGRAGQGTVATSTVRNELAMSQASMKSTDDPALARSLRRAPLLLAGG